MSKALNRLAADPPMSVANSHISINDRPPVVRMAANDNDDINVTDDLARPLPVMRGEGELVRKLLGERFRQILVVGDAEHAAGEEARAAAVSAGYGLMGC